jgi:hypothetical protein
MVNHQPQEAYRQVEIKPLIKLCKLAGFSIGDLVIRPISCCCRCMCVKASILEAVSKPHPMPAKSVGRFRGIPRLI